MCLLRSQYQHWKWEGVREAAGGTSGELDPQWEWLWSRRRTPQHGKSCHPSLLKVSSVFLLLERGK